MRIAESEGLAYAPYSPLANGILTGRYSQGEQPAVGSRASAAPRVPGLLADPAVLGRVRAFDALAADHAVSSAGLALAWVLNHPLITAPVIGISKPSQWEALHEALRIAWTEDLAAAVDDVLPA
jgi:aryl-alcohol dehydrogenase-like predicted oxidoreductase